MGTMIDENVVDATEAVRPNEVVIRLEHAGGGFTSYAIDAAIFAERAQESYALVHGILPGLLKPIIDGALFALRHGPIQKIAKEQGIDVGPLLKSGDDKDAATVGVLSFLVMKSSRKLQTREDGSIEPLDVTHSDIMTAYGGVFRRVPEYDALPAADDREDQPLALGTPESEVGGCGCAETDSVRD